MTAIQRDLDAAIAGTYDLVVVGGGIYGAMLSLEAVRRGLRPVLVERGDFGEATSHNNLRIVHGGLRYLQSADLPRFRESVQERRWWLQHYPDLVRPLGCLMPLDGRGARRGWLLGPGILLNDLLSMTRNRGVTAERRLPRGRLVSASETAESLPSDRPGAARGGALWWDAFAPDMPRLLIETLRWSCAHGATLLNYAEADEILTEGNRVTGVRIRDHVFGGHGDLRAPVVVNAAGPWCRELAARAAPDRPELFHPSLAWNLLFDRAAPSDRALAVAGPGPGAQVLFAVPWRGRLLVGTGHSPWTRGAEDPVPDSEQIEHFVREVDAALPGLGLGRADVSRVFSGLLPTKAPGASELTHREVRIDHGAGGGPEGFHSVSGIKFTTARRVADKALGQIYPEAAARPYGSLPRPTARPSDERPWDWQPDPDDSGWLDALRDRVVEESVQHLDDLLLRRSSLGDNPRRAMALAERACALFGWDPERRKTEIERLSGSLARGGVTWADGPLADRSSAEGRATMGEA